MVAPEVVDKITNMIIRTILNVDKEIQTYLKNTEEYAKRINYIDVILTKADVDFGSEFIDMLCLELIRNNIKPLNINKRVINRLVKKGCSFNLAVNMYKFINEYRDFTLN